MNSSSVQPYNGPIPEFSPSPSPHPRHENSLRPLGMDPRAENTASTGSWPIDDPMVGPSTMMGHATQAQQVEVDQQTQVRSRSIPSQLLSQSHSF